MMLRGQNERHYTSPVIALLFSIGINFADDDDNQLIFTWSPCSMGAAVEAQEVKT